MTERKRINLKQLVALVNENGSLTPQQIAELTGISQSQARARIHEAAAVGRIWTEGRKPIIAHAKRDRKPPPVAFTPTIQPPPPVVDDAKLPEVYARAMKADPTRAGPCCADRVALNAVRSLLTQGGLDDTQRLACVTALLNAQDEGAR
jgi:hypothetical protein